MRESRRHETKESKRHEKMESKKVEMIEDRMKGERPMEKLMDKVCKKKVKE